MTSTNYAWKAKFGGMEGDRGSEGFYSGRSEQPAEATGGGLELGA